MILTKNSGDRFKFLLEKISAQNFTERVEIVVIDSGSTDETLEIAKEFETKIYQIKPNDFHHSRTRNLGADFTSGNYLVYLSQDAFPVNNNWLQTLITPLKSQADIVYGRQIAYEHAKPMDKFFYDYFYPDKKLVLTKEDMSNPKRFCLENVFLSDVNAAMKRDIWSKVRFSEDVSFAEDKDFAMKALERGHKIIFEPNAAVYHSHDYTIHSLYKRRFNDGFTSFKLSCSPRNNTRDKGQSFISEGLKYWRKESHFLIKNGFAKWLPYAFLYDLVFFIAFRFGELRAKTAPVFRTNAK